MLDHTCWPGPQCAFLFHYIITEIWSLARYLIIEFSFCLCVAAVGLVNKSEKLFANHCECGCFFNFWPCGFLEKKLKTKTTWFKPDWKWCTINIFFSQYRGTFVDWSGNITTVVGQLKIKETCSLSIKIKMVYSYFTLFKLKSLFTSSWCFWYFNLILSGTRVK